MHLGLVLRDSFSHVNDLLCFSCVRDIVCFFSFTQMFVKCICFYHHSYYLKELVSL